MNFDSNNYDWQPPSPYRSRLNLLAVIVGAVSDVVVTYALMWITSVALVITIVQHEQINDIGELGEELQASFNLPFTIGCLILLGTLCTVFGGFISASLGGRDHVRHGFATGLVVLVYGFVMAFNRGQPEQEPAWFQAMSHLIVIPAAMLGGWLRSPKLPKPPPQTDPWV